MVLRSGVAEGVLTFFFFSLLSMSLDFGDFHTLRGASDGARSPSWMGGKRRTCLAIVLCRCFISVVCSNGPSFSLLRFGFSFPPWWSECTFLRIRGVIVTATALMLCGMPRGYDWDRQTFMTFYDMGIIRKDLGARLCLCVRSFVRPPTACSLSVSRRAFHKYLGCGISAPT